MPIPPRTASRSGPPDPPSPRTLNGLIGLRHLPCVAAYAAADDEKDTEQDIGPPHPAYYSAQSVSPGHGPQPRTPLLRLDFSELTGHRAGMA
jgi:hypothetical protein